MKRDNISSEVYPSVCIVLRDHERVIAAPKLYLENSQDDSGIDDDYSIFECKDGIQVKFSYFFMGF